MNKLDQTLLQGTAILDHIGVPYFLMFGTLLGIIREGKLLASDIDVDVGVFIENLSPKKKARILDTAFLRNEMPSSLPCSHMFWEFRNGTRFDIFPFYIIGDKCCASMQREYGLWWPKKYFKRPLNKIEYLGRKWDIPHQPEKVLTHYYGDWKKENKKFMWNRDAKNKCTIEIP